MKMIMSFEDIFPSERAGAATPKENQQENAAPSPKLTDNKFEIAPAYSLIEQRKSGELYHEQDVRQILTALMIEAKHAVVVLSKKGGGKSSTMIELEHTLRAAEYPSASFVASEWVPSPFELNQFQVSTLADIVKLLTEYAQANPDKKTAVVIDAADYLFLKTRFAGQNDFQKLTTSKKLSTDEKKVLASYQDRKAMLELLKKPCFQVVLTKHSTWPIEIREPTLYKLWEELVADGAEHTVNSRIPVDKGVVYLQDREDLRHQDLTKEMQRAIATAFEYGDLVNLNAGSFAILVNRLSKSEPEKWSLVLQIWLEKNSISQPDSIALSKPEKSQETKQLATNWGEKLTQAFLGSDQHQLVQSVG